MRFGRAENRQRATIERKRRDGLDSRRDILDGVRDPAIDDAKPVHKVHLKGFWIDKTEVTNEAFAKFVKATGYKTVAEGKPESIESAELLVLTPPTSD